MEGIDAARVGAGRACRRCRFYARFALKTCAAHSFSGGPHEHTCVPIRIHEKQSIYSLAFSYVSRNFIIGNGGRREAGEGRARPREWVADFEKALFFSRPPFLPHFCLRH